jgi:invasion protein IalB
MTVRHIFGFGGIVLAVAVSTLPATEVVSAAEITFTPWTKFCTGETCFIGADARTNVVGLDGHSIVDCGSVAAAALIEPNGGGHTALRVTFPARVSLEHRVRITIGDGAAIERPYVNCYMHGCTADYDAGPELIDQLKQAKTLSLEATDKSGSLIKVVLPLVDFANAYNGPSKTPKVFEASSEKMAEFKKQAEEDRKICLAQNVR